MIAGYVCASETVTAGQLLMTISGTIGGITAGATTHITLILPSTVTGTIIIAGIAITIHIAPELYW